MKDNTRIFSDYFYLIRGVTITEILVGLMLSGLLLTAGLSMFTSSTRYSAETMRSIKLHQELMLSLELMASELRRAGYWANAASSRDVGVNNNPFMASSTDLRVNNQQNCILFTYDRNDQGAIPKINTGTDDERYGYRLRNGAIQSRVTGPSFDCAATSDWQDITDRSIINITSLIFSPQIRVVSNNLGNKGISYVDLRNIVITISGNLVDSPSKTKTLTYQVRVRNDKYR